MKSTKQLNDYIAPEVEVIGFGVEQGFASSYEPTIEEGYIEDAWK